MDTTTQEVFYDKLTFLYLEMPKFRKTEEELVSQFDKWMYVLKNLHRLQDKPVKLQEKVFEKLFAEAEIAKLNSEDMKAYEESLKVYRDNYSVIETAKKEGKDEGMVDVAREMKKDGHPIEMIAKYTGLTREHIEKL
ncbi:MAG: PD-(D/E)XK nuclease family transposase [Cyclobacteriaceae bacterium]